MDGLGPVLTAGGGILVGLLTWWSTSSQNRSKAATAAYRDATRRLALLRRIASRMLGTPPYEAWPNDLRESLETEVLGE